MGWVRISSTGGVDFKWKGMAPGTEISGIWRGTKSSVNPDWPDLGLIEIDGALKSFGQPTTLGKLLARVPLGTTVLITYLGMKKGKLASYHDFDVDIEAGVNLLPEKKVADTDGAVPF